MTRNNVYAGPAGFYMLRGGPDDLPSGVPGGLPGGAYEIPIAVQDRSFNEDGSLFYPRSRSFFDDYEGPYVGDAQFPSDIAPTWNPEFFGNTNVVNGKTWPFLNVEPRKYRFRILNGSDSRFYILKPDTTKLTFTQIGAEGGFLVAPVVLDQLLVGPAERADVIVDFSAFTPGSTITLLNVGPDSPFGGSVPGHLRADPATTGEVMQFRVVPLTGPDTSAIPLLPRITPLRKPDGVRKVSLNELMSGEVCVDRDNEYVPGVTPPLCAKRSMPLAPLEAQLGIVDPLTGLGVPLPWMAPITENPALGKVEVWEISNFTVDAHPIHLHMVMFQVVNRQPLPRRPCAPARAMGDGVQGHRRRLARRDHQGEGPLRHPGPLRLALPHPLARGQRDDEAVLRGRRVHPVAARPSRAPQRQPTGRPPGLVCRQRSRPAADPARGPDGE